MNVIDRTLNCNKILKICQLRNLVKCKLNIFSGDSRKFWLKEGQTLFQKLDFCF